MKLAIFRREDIAHDAKVSPGVANATEFTIGHNVGSKHDVDIVMEQAKNAGARITDPAKDRFWDGYLGYFQGPDRHLGSSLESTDGN